MRVRKMTENKTPNAQKTQILTFSYRRTGMGGFDDTILISFHSRKVMKSMLRTSRTGHHGNRLYRLLPARYLMYEVSRSNGGNLYCTISIITVKEDGGIVREKEWEVVREKEQILQLEDLPKEIQEILLSNKDSLPLFEYVFLQDLEKEE